MSKTDLSLLLSAVSVIIALTGSVNAAEVVAAFLTGFLLRRR